MNHRLISSVLVGLVGFNAVIQAQQSRPRLVVNIVVDQLRTDYLEYLQSLFGKKGFNKLISDAAYLRDVDFKTASPDVANTSAILATGNWPSANGIPAAYIFDTELKRMMPVLNDSEVKGNNTSENISPRQMRLSSVSDEIAVNGNGLSLIYSIAADPQQAVILAGHAGNAAIWLDKNSGKWASSTYYKEIPQPVAQRNFKAPLASRLDTMVWKPSLSPDKYLNLTQAQRQRPFKYNFPASGRDAYSRFIASPLANREVTDLAIDCLNSLRLGARYSSDSGKAALLGEPIDLLNIGYTLNVTPLTENADCSFEQQDAYIRLDGQLGRLFDAIDKTVGLDNSLIILSSTGYFNQGSTDNEKYRIPSGQFSTRRAASLLNSFLSATFGNADYIDSFVDGNIYISQAATERRNLNPADVARQARTFLLKMSGVANVLTREDLLNPATEETRIIALSNDPRKCGDLIVTFSPGWEVQEDFSFPTTTKNIRSAATVAPAFFLGADVVPQVISNTIDATAIAPTVTQILRIRSPNGAVGRPILLSSPRR